MQTGGSVWGGFWVGSCSFREGVSLESGLCVSFAKKLSLILLAFSSALFFIRQSEVSVGI